jgi:hypothetical protein
LVSHRVLSWLIYGQSLCNKKRPTGNQKGWGTLCIQKAQTNEIPSLAGSQPPFVGLSAVEIYLN